MHDSQELHRAKALLVGICIFRLSCVIDIVTRLYISFDHPLKITTNI